MYETTEHLNDTYIQGSKLIGNKADHCGDSHSIHGTSANCSWTIQQQIEES